MVPGGKGSHPERGKEGGSECLEHGAGGPLRVWPRKGCLQLMKLETKAGGPEALEGVGSSGAGG